VLSLRPSSEQNLLTFPRCNGIIQIFSNTDYELGTGLLGCLANYYPDYNEYSYTDYTTTEDASVVISIPCSATVSGGTLALTVLNPTEEYNILDIASFSSTFESNFNVNGVLTNGALIPSGSVGVAPQNGDYGSDLGNHENLHYLLESYVWAIDTLNYDELIPFWINPPGAPTANARLSIYYCASLNGSPNVIGVTADLTDVLKAYEEIYSCEEVYFFFAPIPHPENCNPALVRKRGAHPRKAM